MLKVFLILTRNELLGQLRSKARLFWTFVFPILLMSVMLVAFGKSSSLGVVELAFDGDAAAPQARACRGAIEAAFAGNGTVGARVVAPDAAGAAGGDRVRVTWPARATDPVRVAYDFNGPLAARAAARTIEIALVRCAASEAGLPAAYQVRFENDGHALAPLDYGEFFATGILIMAFMSVGVVSTATTIATLRERNTFKMYVCFPVSRFVFLASLIVSRVLLMLAASVTLMLAARYLFQVPLPLWSVRALRAIPIVLLGAAMLLSLGTLLASRARSVAAAEAWCNLIYFPLLFFSDLTIPLRAAPHWLRVVLLVLPTNQFAVALRGVFIRDAGYAQAAWPLAVVAGWTLVFLAGAALTFRWHQD
ncbi:ABC transporter permease [Burkholderia oklahomensis]|uniref:ABC transporter permease n=1 Tax=Burkholderia oklahomensis TaxID=342113 RepID=UPI002654FDD5|nr:ABC transporter permease [Burkholderia oklahomensis]MDN7676310.1 ABC transporter permease [Burkholderia oklahomensis]